MQTINIQRYQSPCGELILGALGEELCLCDWAESRRAGANRRRTERLLGAECIYADSEILQKTRRELDEYFAGNRKSFDIPIRPAGTEFQLKVWKALLEIPYGKAVTYKDIALSIDKLNGVRAVAQAIGSNSISIIIPCHRVIGSNKNLTGYAGGLSAKKHLLLAEKYKF